MSAIKKAKSQKKKSKQVAGEAATVREAQPAEPIRPIITLTTDFGEGYYAGATKGAILDVCPQACIVDITHQITSHDVLEASFSLLCSYPYYPPHTVHLVVVDPGVGSERRGLIVSAGQQIFVGEGTVIASVPSSNQIVVDHKEIKGFMDAMTMGYRVDPPSLLKGLKPGERVRFTIDAQKKAIVKIEKMKQ